MSIPKYKGGLKAAIEYALSINPSSYPPLMDSYINIIREYPTKGNSVMVCVHSIGIIRTVFIYEYIELTGRLGNRVGLVKDGVWVQD